MPYPLRILKQGACAGLEDFCEPWLTGHQTRALVLLQSGGGLGHRWHSPGAV